MAWSRAFATMLFTPSPPAPDSRGEAAHAQDRHLQTSAAHRTLRRLEVWHRRLAILTREVRDNRIWHTRLRSRRVGTHHLPSRFAPHCNHRSAGHGCTLKEAPPRHT